LIQLAGERHRKNHNRHLVSHLTPSQLFNRLADFQQEVQPGM
jgi:hypothetical protein